MRGRTIMTAAALCMALASCSVKESRDVCPFVLDIWQQDCFRDADELRVQVWNGDLGMMDERIPEETFGDVYTVTLPRRGWIGVCGTTGTEDGVLTGTVLKNQAGRDYAPLWAGTDDPVDARGERSEAHLKTHRQHSRITVRIPGLKGHAVSLSVKADCNGVDIRTQQACTGELAFEVELDPATGQASFLLPRQTEDSRITASLTIDGREGARSLDIAAAIAAQWDGFWTRKDLENATLEYDLLSGGVTVTVNPWDVVDLGDENIR